MKKINEAKKAQEQIIRTEIEASKTQLQHASLNHEAPKPAWAAQTDKSAEIAEKMKQDQARLQKNLASQRLERDFAQASYGTKHEFNSKG